MSTFIDEAVEQALAAWRANPDDMNGDNTLSNGIYSIRCSGSEGFVGMFKYLGKTARGFVGKCPWQVVDRQGVTNISTWHGRGAEYHEREKFLTVAEAQEAAIRAAIDHADGMWIPKKFQGTGS